MPEFTIVLSKKAQKQLDKLTDHILILFLMLLLS